MRKPWVSLQRALTRLRLSEAQFERMLKTSRVELPNGDTLFCQTKLRSKVLSDGQLRYCNSDLRRIQFQIRGAYRPPVWNTNFQPSQTNL